MMPETTCEYSKTKFEFDGQEYELTPFVVDACLGFVVVDYNPRLVAPLELLQDESELKKHVIASIRAFEIHERVLGRFYNLKLDKTSN